MYLFFDPKTLAVGLHDEYIEGSGLKFFDLSAFEKDSKFIIIRRSGVVLLLYADSTQAVKVKGHEIICTFELNNNEITNLDYYAP